MYLHFFLNKEICVIEASVINKIDINLLERLLTVQKLYSPLSCHFDEDILF